MRIRFLAMEDCKNKFPLNTVLLSQNSASEQAKKNVSSHNKFNFFTLLNRELKEGGNIFVFSNFFAYL